MPLLPQSLSLLLHRWSRDEETALRQMTERRTAMGRLAGYSRSEQVEAKFLLFAAAPFCLVLLAKEIGLSGKLLTVGLWLSVAWALVISSFCFAAIWRAIRRSMTKQR